LNETLRFANKLQMRGSPPGLANRNGKQSLTVTPNPNPNL